MQSRRRRVAEVNINENSSENRTDRRTTATPSGTEQQRSPTAWLELLGERRSQHVERCNTPIPSSEIPPSEAVGIVTVFFELAASAEEDMRSVVCK